MFLSVNYSENKENHLVDYGKLQVRKEVHKVLYATEMEWPNTYLPTFGIRRIVFFFSLCEFFAAC